MVLNRRIILDYSSGPMQSIGVLRSRIGRGKEIGAAENSQRCSIAGFEDGRGVLRVKDDGQPLDAGKGKESDFTLESPERNTAPLTA